MANTLKFGNGEWYGKKDTILAYNDENSNYKPLPFDFSRASKATVINKDGLIETVGSGQPRIDYKDDSKGALLLEPARTNYLLQSNQFDTTWSATNLTVTSGQTGVGGSVDAWKLNLTDANSRVQYNISTSGQKSFSIYAKAGTLDFIRLFAAGGDNPSVFFNLSNGTVSSQDVEVNSANIKNIGNGWYRCEMVYNETISSVRIYPAIADGDISQTSGDIYIQYAQLEEGSYPTSYIPTQGSAVTRLAESCSQTAPDSVIGQTEGTVYAEVNVASIESIGTYSGWKVDGTSGNQIAFNIYPTGRIQSTVFDGGSIVVNINDFNYGLTSGTHKIALAYKQNDYILYVDGSVVGSDTSSTVPIVNDFDISYSNGGSLRYNETKLYNTRLSNSELIALTQV